MNFRRLRPVIPPADRRVILLVEDHAGLRDVAETMLLDAGYAVLSAGDGVSAFRLFERHPEIDLVFTDIRLPRIDGLMLADMVQLRRPDVRILYATAYGTAASRQPGYRYGEILAKPYRSAELLAAVARALANPPKAERPAFTRVPPFLRSTG